VQHGFDIAVVMVYDQSDSPGDSTRDEVAVYSCLVV